MNTSAASLLAVLLRDTLDAFGIFGTGLLAIGHRISIKRLLKVVALAGLAAVPLRLLPLSPDMQYSARILVMAFVLNTSVPILSSLTAVMLGSGALCIAEWAASYALRFTLPASLALAGSAALGRALGMKTVVPGISAREAFSDGDFVPHAQVLLALLTMMALALCRDAEPTASVLRLGMLAMPVPIFACSSKRWTGLQTGVLDLVTILPVILFINVHTGGSASVCKFLYMPLVMVNALKNNGIYGAVSLAASVTGLAFMGAQSLAAGQPWNYDADLLLAVALAALYWSVSYSLGIGNRLRKELAHIASIDDLTGLYNYRYLQEHLDRAINSGLKTYLILVDLDNFKSINDRMGHPAGDAFLKSMSRKLKKAVRENDIVVRYGGDEFMVLPEQDIDEEQALVLADRIRRSIEEAYAEFVAALEPGMPADNGLTASVGVACTTAFVRDKDSLLRKADEALYRAKSAGKNRAVISRGAV